jgi:hypothetical protein
MVYGVGFNPRKLRRAPLCLRNLNMASINLLSAEGQVGLQESRD